ncbi:MAG: beta-hydroxyacyl-ACP dehydratase, partial [Lachnospiraceae bacterium]|nr:beta-hydroxyacyl-ACP dehydratase [Lachnospiraceae bacterium]
IYVLLKVDEFKFVKPVIPGDVCEIEVTKTAGGAGLVKFDVKISVDGALRAKGKLAFTSMPKEAVYN